MSLVKYIETQCHTI